MHGRNTQQSPHLTTSVVFITALSLIHFAKRHKRMPLLHVIKHVAHKTNLYHVITAVRCQCTVPYSRKCGWPAQSTDSTLHLWWWWEKTHNPMKTQIPVHDPISNGHHLLSVSFITCFWSELCTAQITQNTTENNCIISNAHIMTAFQPNVFLTANCQGHLKTPQPVSVLP